MHNPLSAASRAGPRRAHETHHSGVERGEPAGARVGISGHRCWGDAPSSNWGSKCKLYWGAGRDQSFRSPLLKLQELGRTQGPSCPRLWFAPEKPSWHCRPCSLVLRLVPQIVWLQCCDPRSCPWRCESFTGERDSPRSPPCTPGCSQALPWGCSWA